MLDHENPETVDAALDALAEIGNAHAVPCLLRWSDGNNRKTVKMIKALATIGGRESQHVLEILSRDHESTVIRDLAREGLSRARSQPRPRGH